MGTFIQRKFGTGSESHPYLRNLRCRWRGCSGRTRGLLAGHRATAQGVGVEAELHLAALGVGLSLALGFLGGRLEGTQAADFIHDPLAIELVFEALERTINGFSFADNDFWHKAAVKLKGWLAAGSET